MSVFVTRGCYSARAGQYSIQTSAAHDAGVVSRAKAAEAVDEVDALAAVSARV